jgi:dTDP-4-dehydrorhamnose 3,5-epimerase
MIVNELENVIDGLVCLQREKRGDSRGFFERMYCAHTLRMAGWKGEVVQVNRSFTAQKGVIRGMHYQHAPYSEYKLVTCVAGSVYDVVVDLRFGSPTFLKAFSFELNDKNHLSIMIPPGCAHGFQTLSDEVELIYCHNQLYVPDYEAGLNALDPRLQIQWPLPVTQRSERDQQFTLIDESFGGVKL